MNTKEEVIVANNISKVYKLYKRPIDNVKEVLHPFNKIYHKNFHALDNVSLVLRRGEALGIIGRNGNGKSTLLKIIAEVLTPTEGTVKSKGRLSAILELTSNLKTEMTGRENIIFNLRIQGYTSKQDIKEKTKEIEEFAEIGEFVDQPVKTYSSGMKSRLGFGIATSVEPDILILDEVLAVGDFNFQQKCLDRINEMRENTSIIFVSHSMHSVRLFCDRVIVLQTGKKVFDGKVDKGIKYYLNNNEKKEMKKSLNSFTGDSFYNQNKISIVNCSWDKEYYQLGDEMQFDFEFELKFDPRNLNIGIPVWTQDGLFITAFNVDYYKIDIVQNKRVIKGCMSTKCFFNPEEYVSVVAIHDGPEYLYREVNDSFIVANKERVFGLVTVEHEWKLK